MTNFVVLIGAFFIISTVLLVSANDGGTFVKTTGTQTTIGNDLFNITFNSNGTADNLFKNGVNLLDNITPSLQKWYLDWNGEKVYFQPSDMDILNNSSEKAHIRFVQQADEAKGLVYIEFHQVVLPNISGLYQYVKISNPTNITVEMAEFRTVYRFDHQLMPKITNIIRSGETPDLTDRPTIQDTTWQLADGSYWSKYDFCGYIRETPWFGVYGGGFGSWLISASREYHSSGPLKQELLVHQDSLMLNYFHSSHFGTANLLIPPGWSKLYGPYLVYINSGDENQVREDSAIQASVEESQWPYSWMNEEEYPLERGSITGKISGQTKAMVVVYDGKDEDPHFQSLGYLYYSETFENGSFLIENIRPGYFQIIAYPLAGQGSENIVRKNINITANKLIDIGILSLPEPTGILWSIGETNRRADGFRYSDELRGFYWHTLPPRNHTFIIGKSNPEKDWYYSQSEGTWKIIYEDHPNNKSRQIRLGLAAATGSLIFNITDVHMEIEVNGVILEKLKYENDKALYRNALQSGDFHAEKFTVSSDLVVDGSNEITLNVLSGGVMYDAISLAEGDE